MADIVYNSSKAVKITSDMRNSLNIYNQRSRDIDNLTSQIEEIQKETMAKETEISKLQAEVGNEDKKIAKDTSKKIKTLQKELEKDNSNFKELETKKANLESKQEAANVFGAQMKRIIDFMSEVSLDNLSAELEEENNDAIVTPVNPDVTPINNDAIVTPVNPDVTPINNDVLVTPVNPDVTPINNDVLVTPVNPEVTPINNDAIVTPVNPEVTPINNDAIVTPVNPDVTPINNDAIVTPVNPEVTPISESDIFALPADMMINDSANEDSNNDEGAEKEMFGNRKKKAVGEYKEEESFVPAGDNKNKDNDSKVSLSSDDMNAIWDDLQSTKTEDNSPKAFSELMQEPEIAPVQEKPIVPIYDESSIFEPIYENETTNDGEKVENENVVDLTPVTEEPVKVDEPVTTQLEEPIVEEEHEDVVEPVKEVELETSEDDIKQQIHDEINEELPIMEVPSTVDSAEELNKIYKEVDVEPQLPDKSKTRDIKNLTLFIDYNDYTFTFGQQHFNKEALTPEELAELSTIKSYLSEKEFNTKRTTQYNKITAENKRLNRKIVTLSKEFTKNVDKLSKDYTKITEDLTKQADKAKAQVEIDRVEKVQTQKLNETLTTTVKEKTEEIEALTKENTSLKATIEEKNKQIEKLENEVKTQATKIKVFEEKLNTVLGIVKEVKSDKKVDKE